ncbi:DUF551 domain-containing protein [Citrobacter freundii]|nr:DUF551 domain-containing protein [Citrobacter freundii]
MTTNHPAYGPVSLDRLHQIREILSKAAAQSDGGNLGCAMDDAVKVIDGAIAAFGAEPMAWRWFHLNQWHVTNDEERARDLAWDGVKVIPLYTAPPAQVVPENYVTAEHRRVIEMLLNVCGAAFELADDSCQQEVDGEECHVVPDDAFQKLSDALDEIENTLPTEDVDRPDVFLSWSAMPRAALKSILQAGNSPVITDTWIPVSEKMPENKPGSYEYIVFESLNNRAHHDYWNVPDCSCDDFSPFWNHYGKYVTHWMPLPSAPQQEVKSALQHGMQRYAGAMLKLSEGDK